MRSSVKTGGALALVLMATAGPRLQEPDVAPVSAQGVQAAIDALSDLDYPVRARAARVLRRAPAPVAAPALIGAVETHQDQFVRFRALVLLTAFNDARVPALMRQSANDPNDRLRTVAYAYYEHHPQEDAVAMLLGALEREESEFVRPALIRALAAHGQDAKVREVLAAEADRGQDFFRSVVIEALGDYRAQYALKPLLAIARLGGPLQVDAVIALGKLKDATAMETLATLQRSAPRENQPPIAAAICLLGVNCETHLGYLTKTLEFARETPGFQELLRNTVTGLVALATSGDGAALAILFDHGSQSVDPPRAPMALGAATVAIRAPVEVVEFLKTYPQADAAIGLIAEGFDMLEEDYGEERFFATVRRIYWEAGEGTPSRQIAQRLIERLEF